MKKVLIYISLLLVITVITPAILVNIYKGEDIKTVEKKVDRKNKEDKKDEKAIETIEEVSFKNNETIKIYNSKTKKTEEIGFEDYVLGVMASEMPAAFHEEALKAQAVAARTYALSRLEKFKNGHPDHKQASLCTDIHCQAWQSRDELLAVHGQKWFDSYWAKLSDVVKATEGQVLTYEGGLVAEPLFHSTSGGKTEASEAVFASAQPYLKSVDSPDEESPKYQESVKMTLDEFINKIKTKYPNAKLTKANIKDKVRIAESSETGRIKKVLIDDKTISGSAFRQMFALNSTNFKINLIDDDIEIQTLGYGHGVGMSQWGANGMAKADKNYKEILKHYYTGVEIKDDLKK